MRDFSVAKNLIMNFSDAKNLLAKKYCKISWPNKSKVTDYHNKYFTNEDLIKVIILMLVSKLITKQHQYIKLLNLNHMMTQLRNLLLLLV